MKLSEFFKLLESKKFTDYVVWVKYKFSTEIDYTYSKEVLIADLESTNNYAWVNDWYEGQQYVEILGYIELDAVYIPLNTYY